MGDDDGGHGGVVQDGGELVADGAAGGGVQGGEGLVEQQQLGIAGQRAGERDALALAAGQAGGGLVGQRADAEAIEELVDVARAPKATFLRTVRWGKSA
ncbi:MAG: hypothetical protein R2736_06220 [Solirubrobacterales bacterium]